MKLKNIKIDSPFFLAPMAGITDSPFRRIMRHKKAALLFSELISAMGLKNDCDKTKKILTFYEDEKPLGIQIFGCNSETVCYAARHAENLGADFIDFNLGCSVPKIVKKGSGAALAREVVKLEKILVALVNAVKIPVSIKIRTGWDTESLNAQEIVNVATQSGIAWVTIHGRTSKQGYSGNADWDFIGKIKQQSSIPIIGNGDLNTPQKACQYFKDYNVDAVMIGRACVRNPFIFEQAKSLWKGKSYNLPTLEDYYDLLNHHKQLLEEHYHLKKALILARKYVAWYSSSLPSSRKFRYEIFKIQDNQEFWDRTFKFFETHFYIRDIDDADTA